MLDERVQNGYSFTSFLKTVTSSALEISDETNSLIEGLSLSAACTARLSPSQVDNMKTNVVFANQAIETAGNAIRATSECLHRIKSDVKNKNWTALTDSGALNMSGRMARDLVKAYESWLGESDVPDSALVKVSARMLARIGTVKDMGKRNHAINKMKRGEGFTEQDLAKIIGNLKSPVREAAGDLVARAEKEARNATEKERLEKYGDLLIENARLQGKLEKQAQINKDQSQEIQRLKGNNKGLSIMLLKASEQGVMPEGWTEERYAEEAKALLA